ncbi:sensor histidine kinase [Glycomyces tenuis]|uniref:sensor histidine kinase n=1 Tax=Glycomyces tenuis TaxID=58116 RepID=UPI00042075BD|nr:histidine kinase [Glycomyces tenuis]
MLDHDPPPTTWLARAGHTAAAALVGIVLGFATLWTGNLVPVALAVVVTTAGVLIAFVDVPMPQITVTVTSLLLTATLVGQFAWSDSIVGLFTGMVYAFCFLTAALVVALSRARRNYVRRGWELAFAEAREQEARIEQAVSREREAMAGEIHDGLGHRLTLIAVQASRLSLDERLPEHVRAEMRQMRENAAAASEELGETVHLLGERAEGVTASLSGLRIGDVIERARASGVTVHGTVEPSVEDALSDYTHAALLRALQEGLTNAAKHAPGAEVRLAIGLEGNLVVLQMRNPAPPAGPPTAPSGHGLLALRHRVAILGGALETERDEDFVLTMRLPRTAMPSTASADERPSRLGLLAEEAADAKRGRRKAMRQAWLVPSAMLLLLVLSTVGYFVYATVASVLPPDRFAAIEVGDDRVETERRLPQVEMLDAPRSFVPEPPGAECHYYEASVSFFERDDVFRICFADERVVSKETIAPDA